MVKVMGVSRLAPGGSQPPNPPMITRRGGVEGGRGNLEGGIPQLSYTPTHRLEESVDFRDSNIVHSFRSVYDTDC
jgi:hypothetical protein